MPSQATAAGARADNGRDAEYGPYYYRHSCGVPYERNEHWLQFFATMADAIVRELRPATVLDAGCGMGFLVEALRERGVEAWGIDVSEHAISQVDPAVSEYCKVASLTEPIERRYDLVVSVEVLEHIAAAEAGAAIANICSATDRLILSSTPDDFSEPTHLNVQPPEAWSASLAREGFLRDVEHDVSFVTPWAGLYVRTEESLDETVRRYDRSWWKLRREGDQLRDSLRDSQAKLAELEAARQEAAENAPSPEALAAKDEEILRLRDTLIGMNAELGAAKGRLAQLEDRSDRAASVTKRIETSVPILGKLFVSFVRMLRRGSSV